MEKHSHVSALIRDIPDFPKPGIIFKDITPVLANGEAFRQVIEWYANSIGITGGCDKIAGIESRGFIFASAVAEKLGVGFVPIRKPGKLPYKTHRQDYDLEYGKDAVEVHVDAFAAGDRVVLIDDLLATGGTATAACELIKRTGAKVICTAFFIELDFLKGRERLKPLSDQVFSLIHF